MKKTISIHLANTIFYIEEDAFKKLSDYFDSIKAHFSKYEGREDVIDDIECRAAEHFSEKLKDKKAVTLKDVSDLIASMGTVADFDDDIGNDNQNNSYESGNDTPIIKKLFRDLDDRQIAGVASGLAAYFNVDPILIRLIFIVLLFINGFGLLAYFILWLIVPEAKTPTDKIKMKGEPLTLSEIDETVNQENLNTNNVQKNLLTKFTYFPFQLIEAIFNFIYKFIKLIFSAASFFIGLGLIVAAAFGIAALVFVVVNLVFNSHSPYFDLSFVNSFPAPLFYFSLASAFVAAFIPLIFILLLGASFISRKSALTLSSGLFLIFFWIMSLVSLGAVTIRVAPQIEEAVRVVQSPGEIIVKDYDYKNFDEIELSGYYLVNLIQGNNFKIQVEGDSKEIDKLSFYQSGRLLSIDKRDEFCFFCTTNSRRLTLNITLPSLSSYASHGAVKTEIEKLVSANLNLNLTGASQINLSGSTTGLTAHISGASRLSAANFRIALIENPTSS